MVASKITEYQIEGVKLQTLKLNPDHGISIEVRTRWLQSRREYGTVCDGEYRLGKVLNYEQMNNEMPALHEPRDLDNF